MRTHDNRCTQSVDTMREAEVMALRHEIARMRGTGRGTDVEEQEANARLEVMTTAAIALAT